MSLAKTLETGANPFTKRTALALVVLGSGLFVALLWLIGNGFAQSSSNDGGAHADGRGLSGFAAFSQLLERRGHTVAHTRKKTELGSSGLLVLTPPAGATADDIDSAIRGHRYLGPTLLILPKWQAMMVPKQLRAVTNAKSGWTTLTEGEPPYWSEKLESFGALDVRVDQTARGAWSGLGWSGTLPGSVQQTLGSGSVTTLVGDQQRQTLVGYRDDGSVSPSITTQEKRSAGEKETGDDAEGRGIPLYPLVIVAEPDLFNNYGMANRERAMLALSVVAALGVTPDMPVKFDLTLAGHERDTSLLTLAFTSPFLSATLCLLLVAGAVGWRAFLRFGPTQQLGRAIAFGKGALVSNTAGLIVRSRRFHLLGAPYAEASRRRLARTLAVPRGADAAAELAAIDRAALSAGAGEHAYSQASTRLIHARNARDLVKAAADLHALERTLTR